MVWRNAEHYRDPTAGAANAVGFAAAYISGRDEGRRREARRQRQEPPIYMDHTHGGDRNDQR